MRLKIRLKKWRKKLNNALDALASPLKSLTHLTGIHRARVNPLIRPRLSSAPALRSFVDQTSQPLPFTLKHGHYKLGLTQKHQHMLFFAPQHGTILRLPQRNSPSQEA